MTPTILFYSASRADFAGLANILLAGKDRFSARLILCNDADGWPAEAGRVGIDCPCAVAGFPLSDDSGIAASTRLGRLTEFVAAELAQVSPDCIVTLGDRYELLALLGAAIPQRVPLAHISGGEVTEGAFDEQVRHAVTKAAHLHFVANSQFAGRLYRMGEEPWRVHITGDPGLDSVRRLDPAAVAEVAARLGLNVNRQLVTVAYHPVTHEPGQTWQEWAAIEMALEGHAGSVVVTAGNVDPQGIELRRRQESWCAANPGRRFVPHLGQRHFLALLAAGGCLLGNSSAGIWEAPAVEAPAVNLGRRQEGRLRGANVLDVPKADAPAVSAALCRALDPAFRASLAGAPSPYGDGFSAPRISEILSDLPPRETLLYKRFIDVEQ